ncbi:hypothetical protein Y695_03701 [Hydrogenophaga sp. T4]|nr:hypothetical protein Y695_03701 [Hydrogenophaga sp. T4]
MPKRHVDQFLELAPGVLEARERLAGIGGGRRKGLGRGVGGFFHVDGYDTCRPLWLLQALHKPI